MKLLTVAIPCYNSQDYMEHAVETALVGGEDVEIILVIGWSAKRPHYSREYNRKLPINDIDNRYQYMLYFLLSIE